MRLQQLVYFVKVVETGGANSAARELFVSQPAVSAGIRELEEELGIPLFCRVRQQMILTDAGLAFYQRIAPLLRELDLAVRETKASGENQDSIRLCLPPMIGMFLFPESSVNSPCATQIPGAGPGSCHRQYPETAAGRTGRSGAHHR